MEKHITSWLAIIAMWFMWGALPLKANSGVGQMEYVIYIILLSALTLSLIHI